MKYPTYLEGYVKNMKDKYLSTIQLCSKSGNELLEIWYYGELFRVEGEKENYIVGTNFAPMKIVAKDTKSNEKFVIFDGAFNGYDNMFCDTYTKEQIENRPLKKFDIKSSKLILELGYSIDYEDEKEDYDYDEDGNIVLIDGRKISFDELIRDGYDYLALSYIDEKGKVIQFVDIELA